MARKAQLNCFLNKSSSKAFGNEQHHEKIILQREKPKEHYDRTAAPEQSTLLPGMKVLVQEGKNWFPATIQCQADEPRSYVLMTPNGYEIRRNRRFLKELSTCASNKFNFHNYVEGPIADSSDKIVPIQDKDSVTLSRPKRKTKKPKRLIEEKD